MPKEPVKETSALLPHDEHETQNSLSILTRLVGPFPLGIWIVLIVVLIPGLVLLVGGQCLSFFSWDTALAGGLQEDDPTSSNMVEAIFAAVSWGEAGADTLVQGTLVLLTLVGIAQRQEFGFVAGNALFILWIYDTIMLTLQRIALYRWDIETDLSRALYIGPLMALLWGIPGAMSIVCLVVNQSYFH